MYVLCLYRDAFLAYSVAAVANNPTRFLIVVLVLGHGRVLCPMVRSLQKVRSP